jgi:tetratricopeptide (TPR) repeat protein
MSISTITEKLKKRKRILSFFIAGMVTLYTLLGYLSNIYIFSNDGISKDSSTEDSVIQSVYTLMASSREKLLNRDYQGALDDVNEAIALADDTAELYLLRGSIYASTNRYDSAIQDYTLALSLNPALTEIYEIRGHLYYEKKDYESALKDYDKVLQQNPNNSEVLLARVTIYFEQENYDYALNDINTLLELEPENGTLHSLAGDVHFAIGNYDIAIDYYDSALNYLSKKPMKPALF